MEKRSKVSDPRISAWIVLFLGTGVTVAANILHAQEAFWPRALSGSIPLILLFAAHTAAYAKSWLVRATMIPVALFAFFVSYDHMNALAMKYGEQYEIAKVYPLAVDGALLMATLVLATYRPVEAPLRWSVEAPYSVGVEGSAEPPLELRTPEPPLELRGGSTEDDGAEAPRSKRSGASAELQRIVEAYPFNAEPPRNVDIKTLIHCGDGKAGNLRRAYLEKRANGSTQRS